jgi:Transposase DDE domain group 1
MKSPERGSGNVLPGRENRDCSSLEDPTQEDTQLVKLAPRLEPVEVTADGEGLVSHAGVALLVELADGVGLTAALSRALAGARERRSAHDPGRVLRDVAVMLADGGDCVTDIAAYQGQERLFGARASETTTHRVLKAVDEQLRGRVWTARAVARARVWDAGARPETITLNIDATFADRAFGEAAGGRQLRARIRVSPAELLSG